MQLCVAAFPTDMQSDGGKKKNMQQRKRDTKATSVYTIKQPGTMTGQMKDENQSDLSDKTMESSLGFIMH